MRGDWKMVDGCNCLLITVKEKLDIDGTSRLKLDIDGRVHLYPCWGHRKIHENL